jgi:hypothetical protein
MPGVDVTNKEAATAAAEGGRGLVRMMRIAVTGSMGQVATSLIEQAGRAFELVLLGRRVFLLEDQGAVLAGLKAARRDVVINAAAYTAVDQAEAEESLAVAINGEGAGHVAETADRIGAPLLQLSTDYVFDVCAQSPLPRGRSARAEKRLRAGCARVAKHLFGAIPRASVHAVRGRHRRRLGAPLARPRGPATCPPELRPTRADDGNHGRG